MRQLLKLAMLGAVCALCAACDQPSPSFQGAGMTFLALGDSYTVGESVPEAARWPVQLAARLQEAGVVMADPDMVARTGWTTDELAAAIETADLNPPYDLVSLLIGVNNQYRGREQADYEAEFAALLQQAIAFAGGDPGRVIVLSIPDWGVTPFAARQQREPGRVAAEIDAFNAINRRVSEAAGAVYVDITPISRQAAADSTLLADDGLHPSGAMYAAWVELLLPVVRDRWQE